MMNSSSSRRRAAFKSGADPTAARRFREETNVQIRKNKKDESLRKRRQMPALNDAPEVNGAPEVTQFSGPVPQKVTAADIPKLAAILANPSAEIDDIVHAVVGFRRLLSIDRNPPIEKILEFTHVLPALVAFLSKTDYPMLMFESAWALTNVASTAFTKYVVQAGAIAPLLRCLHHDRANVREQAAWCLGNIAGECVELRNELLESGAMRSMVLNIQNAANASLLANVTWAVSNLCRGKPSPKLGLVSPAIPVMMEILKEGTKQGSQIDASVLVDAAWAISYVSDGDDKQIEAVMANGTPSILVGLLEDKDSALITPIVRCLGNFVTGTDEQTQAVIDAGILAHAYGLLEHPRKAVRKEMCWLLSNIAAGTQDQVQYLFKHRGRILRKVVDHALNSSWDVRKEAIFSVCNVLTTGNDEQVMTLVNMNGLAVLAESLSSGNADRKVLLCAMDAIAAVMEVGSRNDMDYSQRFDESDGIDNLEALQAHGNEDVYEASVSILERYFDGQEETCDENIAPTVEGNTFAFGMPSKQLNFGSPKDTSEGSAPVFHFGSAPGSNNSMFM